MSRGARILITGGTGFVGRHVTQALLTLGYHLTVLSRQARKSIVPGLQYERIDLQTLTHTNARALAKRVGTVDCLLYMAANIPVAGQKKETFLDAKRNTFDPFAQLLDALGAQSQKIVYTSTIDVYGTPAKNPIRESTPAQPETPYAVAKFNGEVFVQAHAKHFRIPLTILRFAQVYGPNEPLLRVIPYLVRAAKERTPFARYGSGRDKRRFLYVEDAARSVVRAVQSTKTGIYNIAGPDTANVNDIITLLGRLTKNPLTVLSNDAQRPAVHLLPDATRAKLVLRFTPRFHLRAGLQQCLNRYHTPHA